MSKPNTVSKVIAILFLLIIGYFSVNNIDLLRKPTEQLSAEEIDFSEYVADVADTYRNSLKQKEAFITMNGYYARLSGNRVSNEIIRLKNGMLTEVQGTVDPSYGADALKKLQEYLTDTCDVPFLFVEMPRKPDLENKLVPTGTVNESHENANGLLKLLDENGVPYLDLRPYICANEEQINQYFYITDHHWNAEGAFVGFQKITEYLQELFPEEHITSYVTDRNNWELHSREDYFLGSHGRRVGIGFAGVEDLIWLTPKFETELSCAIPDSYIFRKGSFAEATFSSQYLAEKPDYYNTNPYALHTGADYPHVQFRNADAPCSKKILLIKDSFGLPLEGFLATAFQEVETLDVRHLQNYTAIEIIERFKPDMVMVMYNPSFAGDVSVYNFGLDTQQEENEVKLLVDHEYLEASIIEDSSYRFLEIYKGLENSKAYTLTFDSIEQTGKQTGCIVATLFDAEANLWYDFYIPDLVYIQETGGEYRWIFNTPETSEGRLDLLIYTALPGETAGVGAIYRGVSLYEGTVYK